MTAQRVHFIAIGGSIMHSLAIDAHRKGDMVSGSDDEIFEPSRSRLASHGLLPDTLGWNVGNITPDLDAVIVGMHARADNPELLKAQELGIKIYSYPEYIYAQSQHKQRVVIAGSHGKTTVTAMVMHVLKAYQHDFDYLIGAQMEGFEHLVRLTHDAPVIIIEGDEYPTAPFDPTPKFMHYHHHIGVITGIAWDHMNVYKTLEDYIAPFEDFADASPKAGTLIYSQEDLLASVIGTNQDRTDVLQMPFQVHQHRIIDGVSYLTVKGERVPVQVFGEHNMRNISAAKLVCLRLGITEDMFYNAISSFKGAAKRLEKVAESADFAAYKDFAHSPSKVLATTMAVKKQFVERKLIAVYELHTFSSLNVDFLPQYADTLAAADQAFVYFNPHALEHKGLPALDAAQVAKAFKHDNLRVFSDTASLQEQLQQLNWQNKNLLVMSSGNFGGWDFEQFAREIADYTKI